MPSLEYRPDRPWKPGSESPTEIRKTPSAPITESIMVIPQLPEEILVYEAEVPTNKA